MALLKTKEAITSGEWQAEIKVEAVYRNHEWGDQLKKNQSLKYDGQRDK